MSKLHIDEKGGKYWSSVADGDGNLSQSQSFSVSITAGKVSQGKTYRIREGQSPTGNLYNCKTGAEKGGQAEFKFQSNFPFMSPDNTALLSLWSALVAAQKIVTIQIAQKDLETLKGSNYQLCFAKKVGDDDYNVVWQSYHDYLANSHFSWTPQYQLFGSNSFGGNIQVSVSTDLVDIGLGQTTTLDKAGNFSPSKTGGSDTSLNMINDYGSIHPGVTQVSTGINGKKESTPIYVAPNESVSGEISLTPVEKVLVWFEQKIETSTMFSTSRSNSQEIDLTNSNTATWLYKDQKWIIP